MPRHKLCVAVIALCAAACAPVKQPVPPLAQVEPPASWLTPNPSAIAMQEQWWRGFGDPQLTGLVESALLRNTDVLSAVARVDEAREQIRAARAALLPGIDATVNAQRSRSLQPTGVSLSTSTQPQLAVSYELDIWGRLRKLRDTATLRYQATQAERDAVSLAVAGTTARAYISLLSLDRQLTITQETLKSRRQALSIAQDQASLGYTSQLELTQAQSEYESTAQLVPQLEQAIGKQEHALALLAGDMPRRIERGAQLGQITPPPVPNLLPSELLRRRPDIRQAELLLAASDLNLDAARDRFLPQVQLSASIGSLFVNSLDYDPVRVWSLGGSILAPLFNRGELRAGVGIAAAQRDQAAYAYRAAALQAFSDVEDSLSGIQKLAAQLERVNARRRILTRSLAIAHDRYQGGYSSYLEELDAQRNLFNTELAAVQTRESQLNNLITLYQALGGGWQADLL